MNTTENIIIKDTHELAFDGEEENTKKLSKKNDKFYDLNNYLITDDVVCAFENNENASLRIYERIPFFVRMVNSNQEIKDNYNTLKNEIMSYGVNSRVSSSGDAFRLHCKTFVKLTISGNGLKLYFALNPKDYYGIYPVSDAGNKGVYKKTPMVFKVRSGLAIRRAKKLINDVMSKNGLLQSKVGNTDWVQHIVDNMDQYKQN